MSENKANSVKEVLIAAQWLIQNIGWTQHNFVAIKDGEAVAYCILGAINMVQVSDEDFRCNAKNALHNIIGINIPISDWNDSSSRTKEGVLSVFDEAIQQEEECT